MDEIHIDIPRSFALFDRILEYFDYELDIIVNGMIAENGKHEQFIKDEGLYNKLYDTKFKTQQENEKILEI